MKKDYRLEKQSTTKGFAILSVAVLLSKIISVLYLPILSKILKSEGIGVYAYVYNIYTFMYIMTTAGLPSAISKIVSELNATGNYKDAHKSFIISRNLLIIIGTIMAVVMFLFADVYTRFVNFPEAALAVKVLSPALLLTAVLSAYRGYFQGRGNMTPTAFSQVIEQFINAVLSIGAAYILIKYSIEEGVAGATIGTTFGALAGITLLLIIYRNHKIIKTNDETNEYYVKYTDKKLLKKILNYAIPITLCLGLQNAGLLIDGPIIKQRLLLSGYSVETAKSLWGWFGSWYTSLINVPIAIVMQLAVAVLPAISELSAIKDKAALQEKIKYAFRLAFIISIPAAIGLMSLNKGIYILFGYEIQAAVLMKYGAFILILIAILQIEICILQGIGKIYIVTLYSVIGLIAKIAVNYLLIPIPSINIKGALIGNAVCYLVPLILNYITIKRTLQIKINLLANSIKPAFASAIMGISAYLVYYFITKIFGITYLVNAVAILISIGLAILIYMYSLISVGGITEKDIEGMPSKIKRVLKKFMK